MTHDPQSIHLHAVTSCIGSVPARWWRPGNCMRGLQMVAQIDPSPAKALVDISSSSSAAAGCRWISHYAEVQVPSQHGIHLSDITKQVQAVVEDSGVLEGQVNVLSRHTTTAITINEMEGRLMDDARQYLLKLAPASYPYLHNDLHLRKGPPGMVCSNSTRLHCQFPWVQLFLSFAAGWPGGDEAWRAQEPVNAHSHLLVMLLGASETVPIHKGRLMLGTWQSLIMVVDASICIAVARCVAHT